MTDQKTTGVFVRFPLSENDIRKMDIAISQGWLTQEIPTQESCTEEGILTIGTPVTSGELTHIGTIAWFEKDREPSLASYCPALFKAGDSVPVASLPIAQAQIAALEAEVVRLREALDRIRLIPFPMMDLPAGIMHGIAHKALKGGAA